MSIKDHALSGNSQQGRTRSSIEECYFPTLSIGYCKGKCTYYGELGDGYCINCWDSRDKTRQRKKVKEKNSARIG